MNNTLLIAGSIHAFSFAAFHLCFWRIFRWRTELKHISPINGAVMQVLNLCLTYLFIALGLVTLADREEVLGTRLGHHLMLVLSLFWLIRLIEQFVFFQGRSWRSVLLNILFAAGAVIYGVPLVIK